MGELLIDKGEARKFLRGEVIPNYRTMADFEAWVKNYKGPFKDYLFDVVEHLRDRNKGDGRSFGLVESDVESILKKTIPQTIPLKDS